MLILSSILYHLSCLPFARLSETIYISWYFLIMRVCLFFVTFFFYLLILCHWNKATQRNWKKQHPTTTWKKKFYCLFSVSFHFSNSFLSYWERSYRGKYVWYLIYEFFVVAVAVVVVVAHLCLFRSFNLLPQWISLWAVSITYFFLERRKNRHTQTLKY